MTTTRNELVLVCCPRERWRRLPVVEVRWHQDKPALVDRCGRRRSPATLPGFRTGRKPANFGKTYLAEPLSAVEVAVLIAGCSRTSPTGLRNRALIAVLYRAGLRISEALALLPGDIDHAQHTVLVRCGKGGKMRRVGIDDGALVHVQAWETRRAKLGITRHEPLFCTIAKPVTGGPLQSPYIRVLLKRLALEAGITKRVHPHGFRHTMAVELSREKTPLALIQRQLGHSSPGTTGIYLQGISNQEVIDVMAEREWSA